jgi:hypothetical protein
MSTRSSRRSENIGIVLRGFQAVSIALIADQHAKKELGPFAFAAWALLLATLFILEYLGNRLTESQRREEEGEFKRTMEVAKASQIDELRQTLSKRATDLEARLNMTSAAVGFLVTSYRRTTKKIHEQLASLAAGKVSSQEIQKVTIINDVLREMCNALKEEASLSKGASISDLSPKATFMEVTGPPSVEELRYIAWYTPSAAPPLSCSKKVGMRRGVGCAGIAWERGRPVIEDQFRDGREWHDSYPGQGALYRDRGMSMVSVPVAAAVDHEYRVIGVITVDMNVTGFFGSKGSTADEERAGRWLGPYAEYISFVYVLDELVKALRARLPHSL